jgi:preprotein translocase subunit SecF
MEDLIIGLVVALAILVFLFFIFRELLNWYWKINERISVAHKTNFLLEKISMQLGASDLDEITIEEISTGEKKKVKMDKWIEFKIKNPKTTGYRTVKDDASSENH